MVSADEINEQTRSVLGRDATPVELLLYASIDNTLVLEQHLQDTREYESMSASYVGATSYEAGDVVVSKPHLHRAHDDLLIGNGKIAATPSGDVSGMGRMLVATRFNLQKGVRESNVIDGFNASILRIKDMHTQNVTQRLRTSNGTFVCTYKGAFIDDRGGDLRYADVRREYVALRQYPHVFMTKMVIKNMTSVPIDVTLVHHTARDERMTGVDHRSMLIERNVCTVSSGLVEMWGRNYEIRCGTAYRLPSGSRIGALDSVTGERRLHVAVEGSAQVELRLLVIQMTDDDVDGEWSVMDALLNSATYDTELSYRHTKAWEDLWKSNVEYSLDLGADVWERNDAQKMVTLTRMSLFTLYSRLRGENSLGASPLQVSIIDTDGDLFWNCELFVLPVLLVLHPSIARMLLDHRYYQLDHARRLANVHGYEGAKYPYRSIVDGEMRYRDVYYNVTSRLYTMNTALVGVHCWNYYRVSRDAEWLRTRGYSIMVHALRYSIDLMDITRDARTGRITQILLPETTGVEIDQNRSKHTLSLYSVFQLLGHTLEASFMLRTHPPEEWSELYDLMRTMYHTESDGTNKVRALLGLEALASLAGTNPLRTLTPEENNAVRRVSLPSKVTLSMIRGVIGYTDTDSGKYVGSAFGAAFGRYLEFDPNVLYEFALLSDMSVRFLDSDGAPLPAAKVDLLNGSFVDGAGAYSGGAVRIEGASLHSVVQTGGISNDGLGAFVSPTDSLSKKTPLQVIAPYETYAIGDPQTYPEIYWLLSESNARLFRGLVEKRGAPWSYKIARDSFQYYDKYLDRTGEHASVVSVMRMEMLFQLLHNEGDRTMRIYYKNELYKEMRAYLTTLGDEEWLVGPNLYHFVHAVVFGAFLMRFGGVINSGGYLVESFGPRTASAPSALPEGVARATLRLRSGRAFDARASISER
jgi:hypothetical protein